MAIDFEITPPGSGKKSFTISLDMDKILIGRGGSCDIRLPSPTVSYHHATIELVGVHYTMTDAESKNGTSLNGKRLIGGKRYRLSSDDVVTIC
jgi:pSer/pThr/pTyr-binding forkhead associated (FHA) protein